MDLRRPVDERRDLFTMGHIDLDDRVSPGAINTGRTATGP
jgi:hypothetical protein